MKRAILLIILLIGFAIFSDRVEEPQVILNVNGVSNSIPQSVYQDCRVEIGEPENKYVKDWNAFSACVSRYRIAINQKKIDDLREFLKENPRYRFPGQSLNKCFGKARERGIANMVKHENGTIIVYYKKEIEPCIMYKDSVLDNKYGL